MCGIAGLVIPGRTPDAELLKRMTETLRHRGPDDGGFHIGPDIGLGFRRLSIIDLATGGQPVSNRDGTVQAVFNGEIYNFRELRAELEGDGHHFRTSGDAEVLPHLYEERGVDMLKDLNGMFAFALWDSQRRQLLLARDRLGEKPLYYTEHVPGGGFAFGSEIKALLAAGVSRDPDRRALVEYLYHLYIPPPRSAFASIAKLEPGRYLLFREGRPEIKRYWSPHFRSARRTDAEHVEGLRQRVFEAVSSRVVADVPVGAFLSGGVDSAAVVAGMCAAHRGPVHTFTITFDGFEHYDESVAARTAAEHFGTEHHELRAELDGPSMLPALVDSFDEPFGNATAVLEWSLSEATRQHVKVVLTGDGADELFFGYPRFKGLALHERYQRMPIGLRSMVAAASGLLPEDTSGNHQWRRAREFLSTGHKSSLEAYASWIGYFTPDLLADLLTPELIDEARFAPDFLLGLADHTKRGDLNEFSRIELESFLPCNVLEYADRMSMANGLELRAPFLDHRLVEYVATMPADLKLRGKVTKWALREALGPELPAHALKGAKRGLNPPLGAWLRNGAGKLIRDLLDPEVIRRRGLFRPEAVARLLDEQERGRRDRSLHIWALLVLELWFRQRVDVS